MTAICRSCGSTTAWWCADGMPSLRSGLRAARDRRRADVLSVRLRGGDGPPGRAVDGVVLRPAADAAGSQAAAASAGVARLAAAAGRAGPDRDAVRRTSAVSRPLDRRDDDLLLSCAATAQGHRLAIAWTDGVEGTAAKRCGSGWKLAMPLAPGDEAAAAFSRRCRNRNPAVVASASGLVLVDADGGLVGEMTERLGLPRLPITLGAISRRGSHAYLRPPTGY